MKIFTGKFDLDKLLKRRAKRSHQENIEAKYAESIEAEGVDPVKATAEYVTDMVRDKSTNPTNVLAATIDSGTPEEVFREAVKQIVLDPTIPNSPIAAAVNQSSTNFSDEQIIRLLNKVPFNNPDIRLLINQIDDQDRREEQILVALQNYYNSDFSNSNEEDVINRLKGVYSTFDFENEDIDNMVQRIVAKRMAITYHECNGKTMPEKYKSIPPTSIDKMIKVNMPELVAEEYDKLYPEQEEKCDPQIIKKAILRGMEESLRALQLIYKGDFSKMPDSELNRSLQRIYSSLDFHNEDADKLIQKIVAKQMAVIYHMFNGGIMPQKYNDLPPTTIEKMMEVDMPTLVENEYNALYPQDVGKCQPSVIRMAILKKMAEEVAVVHKNSSLWVIPSSKSMQELTETEEQYFINEILKRESLEESNVADAKLDIEQQISGNYDVDKQAQKEFAADLNALLKPDRLRTIKAFRALLEAPEAEAIIRTIAECPEAIDCIAKFGSTGALESTMKLSPQNRKKAFKGFKAAVDGRFFAEPIEKKPEDSNPGEGSGVAGNPGGNPGENPGGNPSGNPGGDPGGEPGGRGASNPPAEDKDHTL